MTISDSIFKFRKYRAWHKELKTMLYPPHAFDSMLDCRDSEGNHVVQEYEEEINEHENEIVKYNLSAHVTWDGRWYVAGKYQDVVWLQFTGLKTQRDKDEIFEGDFLKHKGRIGVVRYESDYGGYILEFEYSKNQHHELLTCDVAFESEHIGNIYQNPELIKP
jgi:uncharacterized phage protein (TIGR01671 family)